MWIGLRQREGLFGASLILLGAGKFGGIILYYAPFLIEEPYL